MPLADYKQYVAMDRLPSIWCPGCGNGTALKALALALAELEIPPDKTLLANGIGCSGRVGDYVRCHRFHGTHGRTLAFVTGIKLVRPEIKAVCFLGDGDCAAIGMSHFVHSARRNVDIATIVVNNFNYGMTGGQFSPLSPHNAITSTSSSGKPEPDIDICKLADVAGANYVSRTTIYHVTEMKNYIKEALGKKGFSFVEIISPCPTYYARYNKLGNIIQQLEWLKDKFIPIEKYNQMEDAEKENFFWRGRLTDRNLPDLLSAYTLGSRG
jgi:2-oxoglutarate ferredoxin oxidoreductase subunit beta